MHIAKLAAFTRDTKCRRADAAFFTYPMRSGPSARHSDQAETRVGECVCVCASVCLC